MIFTAVCGFSQKTISLQVHYSDPLSKPEFYRIDSVLVQKKIADVISDWKSKGYINARSDTLFCNLDICHATLYIGKKYKIGGLLLNADQRAMLEESGVSRDKFSNKYLDSTSINSYLNKIASHYANNGYPFAVVGMDSSHFEGENLYASLKINKGNKITFDTVYSEGRMVMANHFITRFLDIKKDEPYAHEKILKASSRINDLQYITQRLNPYIKFINDKASVVLTLDPRPASRFDFLIGVFPQSKEGITKWNLSGDFTAELNNSFRQGEYTFIQFKKLKPEFLELIMKSTIPYVAGLPVGSHLDFRIFKNGLQNIDLYFDGGIQYLFNGFNQIKIFGSYRSSSLLEINTAQIISSNKLPSILDISYTGAGIGLNIRKLDYRFNPRKGVALEANSVFGTKKIRPNRQIVDLPGFAESYDTLKLSTLQAEFEVAASLFRPVSNWATLRIGINAGLRYNERGVLMNELMRIGGSKLLRGFDEESILTDFYSFGTAEFRIILDRNSYISLPFFDVGYTRVLLDGQKKYDPVMGVGLGLNFGTTAGIFNLSFAAGRNLGNPWDFGKMKIHFGYVNLF